MRPGTASGLTRLKRGIVGLLAVIVFLSLLGGREIVTSHEARVAQTARQMAASGWPWNATAVEIAPVKLVVTATGQGSRFESQWDAKPIRVNPWLVPVLSGEVRLQKPPLAYWCAAILYRLAGVEWSETLARLIPAILGAACTLLIYELARQTYGRTIAWAAALAWVSSYFIAEQFRLSMADPYLAFFTLLAMCAWIRGATITFYLAIGLGILSKGPLFVPLVVGIVAYELCLQYFRPLKRTLRSGISPTRHLVGIAIVALLVLPWVIYVYKHVPNVAEVWRYESVGELPGADNVEKARPIWFYLPYLLVITLPWMPVWLVGVVGPLMRRRRRRELFPIAWYLIVVAFFSLMPVKKPTYLLPAMAAQVLIISQELVAVMALIRRFPRLAILAWIQAVIGIGVALLAVALSITKVSPEHRMGALAVSALAFGFAFGAVAELRSRAGRAWLWRQAIAYVLAIVAVKGIYMAEQDDLRSAKPLCKEVIALMQQTGESLAPGRRPEEAALYLPLNLPLNLDAPTMLTIIDDPRHTSREKPERFADRVPWRKVLSAERIETPSSHGDGARWKLYRLGLAPAGVTPPRSTP